MADWLGLVVVIGIFLVMAGFSCTIEFNKFFSFIRKPKAILIGLFCQYGCLPLAAFFISQMLNLAALHSIAFIITASCPGGTLSNFWCWFFASDLELSIAMTASSSLLSFAFLTINCIIYMPLVTDASVVIDYVSLGISVSSLILGVVFGLIIGYRTASSSTESKYAPRENKYSCRKVLIIMGSLSMLITLLLATYQNTLVSSVPAYELPFEIFIAAAMLNGTAWLISFILSYFVCSLPHNQSITVCIECANQNVGVSIALILLTMNRAEADIAVGVPMFYGVLNAVVIFIFGLFFRLCGFIENNDDEINHTFENSGFTKLCQFINKEKKNKEKSTNRNNSITTRHRHRQLGSNSSMLTLKSTTPPDIERDIDNDNDNAINMLMEEYEMSRTPSDEELAVKQPLQTNNAILKEIEKREKEKEKRKVEINVTISSTEDVK